MESIGLILAGWIEQGWDLLKFGVVVNEYDGTIIMRFGKYHRTCPPGWNWKWPIFEEANNCFVTLETYSTKAQCLLTLDGVSVMVEGAIKGNVEDPKIHLLKVRDFENSISDVAQGLIKKEICSRTFDDCRANSEAVDKEITKAVRREAKKFGLHVETVILTTFDKVRTTRWINQ